MTTAALPDLAQKLVASLIPPLAGDRQARDLVVNEIRADAHGGTRKEWEDVRGFLDGLARAARVRVQDGLADALDKAVGTLEEHRAKGASSWEGDMPIKMSNVPQHVQLLLNLAGRPGPSTHRYASAYLERTADTGPSADQLLYNEIMAEPFTGPHWEAGFDEEIKRGWTDSESESEESSEDEEVVTPASKGYSTVDPLAKRQAEQYRRQEESDRSLLAARSELEKLKKRAYWKVGGQQVGSDVDVGQVQGWRQLSTGVPSALLAARLQDPAPAQPIKMITAEQLQRELLFALSGRPGILLVFDEAKECQTQPDHPQVRHYSEATLSGILTSVRTRAAQAAKLRAFIATSLDWSASATSSNANQRHTITKTQQAFADACRVEMQVHDLWLAEQEAAFTLGSASPSSTAVLGVSAASTPMLLLHEYENRFGFLLNNLPAYAEHASRPVTLLNAIHSHIADQCATAHRPHLQALLRIFTASAEIQWKLLGEWLHRGMPIPSSLQAEDNADYSSNDDERLLDPEFFIKRDRDVSWGDEDFWEAGFLESDDGWPSWLANTNLKETILEAGKARGLLRSLVGRVEPLEQWLPLQHVLQEYQGVDDIATVLAGRLAPTCQIAQFQLRRVLEEECGMEAHLDAIEGVLEMRSFDVIEDWCRGLFDKLRKKTRWADSQVLTSSLRDVIEQKAKLWMNPSAIRLRLSRRVKGMSSMSALGSCTASYEVPFPLLQLFTPTSMEWRSEVFTFILQLRYARYILDTVRLDLKALSWKSAGETQGVCRLLQRLTWAINAFWTWITDRILDVEATRYRAQLGRMTSLGSMVTLELQHTRRIRDFCFGNPNMADLKDGMTTILGLTVALRDLTSESEGNGDGDGQSGATVVKAAKPGTPGDVHVHVQGRSRRRLARRRNRSADADADSSDDAGDEVVHEDLSTSIEETQGGVGPSGRTETEPVNPANMGSGWMERLNGLERELNEQVWYVRDGAERLASEPGDAEVGEGWGMLAFALEDWT